MSKLVDDLGVYVSGCGRACDCDWYIRAECPGPIVRYLGGRFVLYAHSGDKVIGKADPGFEPCPEDLEWIEKVEYAEAQGLSWPADWPKRWHQAWDAGQLHELRAEREAIDRWLE